MNAILRFFLFINRLVLYTTGTALVSLICVNVFLRYLFKYSFAWTEQATILLLTWLVFSGAAVGYVYGQHVSLEVVIDKFPPQVKKVVLIIVDLMLLVFLLVVFCYSIIMALSDLTIENTSLPIKMTWFSSSLVFSSLCMLISTVSSIHDKIKRHFRRVIN